jgi:hypothetical protein
MGFSFRWEPAREGAKPADAHRIRADRTSIGVIVPADGKSAATEDNGDFGTSPIFWAALRQATACLHLNKWGAGRKAQYTIENFPALVVIYMEGLVGPASIEL